MKTRFAVSVLALGMAAGSPAAQAQIAKVSLYGQLNVDLEFVKGNTCASAVAFASTNCPTGPDSSSQISNPTVTRVSSNSSRIGVRGTEYLGRGQVAIFQLESHVQADTGNSSSTGLASRETFVGLQGDWGTVKAGKFLTPYDDILPIFGNAPTLTTSILSTAALWAQGPLPKSQGGFDARLGNSIRYETPQLGGFSAELQYSTRDSSGNTSGFNGGDNGDHVSEVRHARVVSAGAFYSNGPLDLGFAYEYNYQVRSADQNDRALSVAAAYDIGGLVENPGTRIGAIYERLNYGTLAGSLTRNFWGFSATVPLGGGSVYAFWGRAGNGGGSAPGGTGVGMVTRGPDTGCDQWEVSYTYALSLRTLLYAGYVRLNNAANAFYTFNINEYPIATGAAPSGIVFGMTHFF
jgi:predicted porin